MKPPKFRQFLMLLIVAIFVIAYLEGKDYAVAPLIAFGALFTILMTTE